MITQTLKRWLNKLFAWWPWGRSNGIDYTHATNSLNRGTTQELVWRTTVDGYVPQPGITSVVVEQDVDDTTPEAHQLPIDDYSERIPQSYQSISNEVPPSSIPQNNGMKELPSFPGHAPSSSSEEQHLTFLLYLVKRRVYNEGFIEGQEPEQYKL